MVTPTYTPRHLELGTTGGYDDEKDVMEVRISESFRSVKVVKRVPDLSRR